MMLNIPWKNLSIVAGVVTAALAILNYTYESGRNSMAVELQAAHNKAIQHQRTKYDEQLQKKLNLLDVQYKDSQEKLTEYYETLLAKTESDLIAEHKTKIKLLEIKNATSEMDDVISTRALQLFQQSTSLVSAPTYYSFRSTSGN